MWPLLILCIAVLAVTFERAAAFRLLDRNASAGCRKAGRIFRAEGIDQARQFCRNGRYLWGKAAALVCTAPFSRNSETVKAEMQAAVSRLDRPLAFLDMVSAAAPVIGFLGTVTGMISAFRSIADASTVQLQLVASGLYEALLTTAFGLIISVAATIASHVFWQMTDRFSVDLELSLSRLSEALHEAA